MPPKKEQIKEIQIKKHLLENDSPIPKRKCNTKLAKLIHSSVFMALLLKHLCIYNTNI